MSKLSLRQLEVFRNIMRLGTMTAAAQALNITQPAASRLLRHAEEQLGTALFHRQNGRLRPTPEARALFPEVDRIFNSVDYVQKIAGDLHRLQAGRLHVATIPSLAATYLTWATERFLREHPAVTIIVSSVVNAEVPEMVAGGRADFGLAFLPLADAEVQVEPIGETHLAAVLPPAHPLCALPELSPHDLVGEPLVSFSGSAPIGQRIEAVFRSAGIVSPMTIEVSSSFLACAFVKAGTGIALVDWLAKANGAFPDLEMRPIKPRTHIKTAILTHPEQPPSLIAKAFMDELRNYSGFDMTPEPPN
ncbi:LysR family transcriptional regulator [Actibacterium sp. MT2.3-13A]|uniref:LysR family transcriptional regulator n=1 Tax=Actibacterium sp. MT2.3-13A TaxID=2828332 RepID=UPI001BA919D2|nr:LysR family transcriptional regulator [Actibacterium sp. MT2.3-13A]